jgi:Flp pilus assembly pilin Flp
VPDETRSMDRGQGLVEYGLILGLTVLLTVIWLTVFGGAVGDALAAIGVAIDEATGG